MDNASSSGFITLEKAIEMTKRHRQNKEKVIHPNHANRHILANSNRFDRKVFDKLLSKPNCAYIRIYYGMDDSLQVNPIVVAVDKDNNDILSGAVTMSAESEDVGDDSLRCPPVCPPPSPLNEG